MLKTTLFLAVATLCIIGIQSRPAVDPNLVPLIGYFKTMLKEIGAAIKAKLSDKEVDYIKKAIGIMLDKSRSDADKATALKAIAKEQKKGFMDEDKKLEAKVKAASKLVDFFTKEIYDKASPRISKIFDGLAVEDFAEIKMLMVKLKVKMDEIKKEEGLEMPGMDVDKYVNKYSNVPAIKAN